MRRRPSGGAGPTSGMTAQQPSMPRPALGTAFPGGRLPWSPASDLSDARAVSAAAAILALGFALVAFSGVRVAGGTMAIADPFFVVSAAVALLTGGSFIASATQRRLLVVAYFVVMAATLSALAGAPLVEHLANMTRFLLAAIGIPLTVMMVARTFREVRVLAAAFVLSACVSSLVALADATLGTGIAGSVTTHDAISEIRFGGLSAHPNHLGIVCAMSLPLALGLGLAGRGRLWRSMPLLAAVVLLLLGVGISGSRAALAGTIAGLIFLSILQLKRLPELGFLLGVASCVIVLLFAGGSLAFENFRTPLDRLLDPTATALSDAGHTTAQASAASAFFASPLWGTGFQDILGGLNVPLQVAASAGLIGVAAFLTLIGTALQAGRRVLLGGFWGPSAAWVDNVQALAAACVAALGAWLVAGLAQNAIFDRFLYVPVGLVLLLHAISTQPRHVGPQEATSQPWPSERGATRVGTVNR